MIRFRCCAPYIFAALISGSLRWWVSGGLSAGVSIGPSWLPKASSVVFELCMLSRSWPSSLLTLLECGNDGASVAGRDEEKMAATRRSSCGFRLFFIKPTIGCELRVIEQLLTEWRYVRAGILIFDLYTPPCLRTLSETVVGTTNTAG